MVLWIGLCLTFCSAPPGGDSATPSADINASASHQRMRRELRHVIEVTQQTDIYLGDHLEQELRAELAAMEQKPSPERLLALRRLALAELHLGREQESLRLFTEAYRMIPQVESHLEKSVIDVLVFLAGLAWLRHGETENCARRHNPDRCLLPIQGQGVIRWLTARNTWSSCSQRC